MIPTRLLALLPLVLAVLAGCGDSPSAGTSAPGAMQFSITLPLAAPGDVSRVNVTVSGADMTSQSTDLVLTGGNWGGVLGDIPAGTGRTFLARAYNASSTLRYEGRADNVTVTAGATGLLALTLQDVTAPPPFSNEAPIVDSLVASTTSVAPGGSVNLTATAHDPNAGDTVSYAWSAPSGVFAAPTQASTSWTAPTVQGPVKLSLQVKDSRGATLSVSLTVTVTAGSGAKDVRVDFNSAPQVVGLSSTRAALDVGQSTVLTVSASDGDGDTLSYQWSATCAGTFTGATTASATFTPSALPTAACNNCQLTVTVKDGRGGQNTGRLALCVSNKAELKVSPQVTRSFQSSLTARAYQQLIFEVGASDPMGLALRFDWSNNPGTLGTAITDATSSRVIWTAPRCIPSVTSTNLYALVYNASGLMTIKDFTITGLPTCEDWRLTGSMRSPRTDHQATLLANGTVLITGGYTGSSHLKTAELYDPSTGTFSYTGSASSAHSAATATLLANGKVLVAGGYNGNRTLETAELYDPATGTWSAVGSLRTAREWSSATLLQNGKVLVAGGSGGWDSAEVFDPATNTWSDTGSPMNSWYFEHELLLLPTGKVLCLGDVYSEVKSYNPATGSWSAAGSLILGRADLSATLLPNGKVLAAGGRSSGTWSSTELYDPSTGTSIAVGAMAVSRKRHTATLLTTGKVLVTGGDGPESSSHASAELFDPNF